MNLLLILTHLGLVLGRLGNVTVRYIDESHWPTVANATDANKFCYYLGLDCTDPRCCCIPLGSLSCCCSVGVRGNQIKSTEFWFREILLVVRPHRWQMVNL